MSFRRPCVATVILLTIAAGLARGGTVYFRESEQPDATVHGDSFVLPLTDPADITHARSLIQLGPDDAGSPIVFAHIAVGSGNGINRDLLDPAQPQWSWHVDQFNGFGDVGIELLDGWSTYVEDHRDSWIQETGGNIGFWSYTVTAELPGPSPAVPLPIPLGVTLAMLGIVGYVQVRRKKTG